MTYWPFFERIHTICLQRTNPSIANDYVLPFHAKLSIKLKNRKNFVRDGGKPSWSSTVLSDHTLGTRMEKSTLKRQTKKKAGWQVRINRRGRACAIARYIITVSVAGCCVFSLIRLDSLIERIFSSREILLFQRESMTISRNWHICSRKWSEKCTKWCRRKVTSTRLGFYVW